MSGREGDMTDNQAKTGSKSNMVMLEILGAALIFALCAACAMRVFAAAKLKTNRSAELGGASLAAQNACELFLDSPTDLSRAADALGGTAEGGELRVFYSSEWAGCAESEASFVLTLKTEAEGGILRADVCVAKISGEEVFSVSAGALAEAPE